MCGENLEQVLRKTVSLMAHGGAYHEVPRKSELAIIVSDELKWHPSG